MEQEAMSEIGNIILNSCVGTLANILSQELSGSLPQYHVGTSEEILTASGGQADTVVLMLHIDFILETHQIHGYVAFVLDLSKSGPNTDIDMAQLAREFDLNELPPLPEAPATAPAAQANGALPAKPKLPYTPLRDRASMTRGMMHSLRKLTSRARLASTPR